MTRCLVGKEVGEEDRRCLVARGMTLCTLVIREVDLVDSLGRGTEDLVVDRRIRLVDLGVVTSSRKGETVVDATDEELLRLETMVHWVAKDTPIGTIDTVSRWE